MQNQRPHNRSNDRARSQSRFGNRTPELSRLKWAFVSLLTLVLVIGLIPQFAQADEEGPGAQPRPTDDVNEPSESDTEKTEVKVAIPTHPVEVIKKMEYWLIPFLIASVIAVWFGIERIVVLRRTRVIPVEFVEPFLNGLASGKMDAPTAVQLCENNDSPIAAVFAHGVRKWGRPSIEVEQAVIDGGDRQVGHLRKHLRVLNGVATVTPLLGLLGTVVGMIQAFNDIASAGAMGKADQLAAGIAMALLTTAFGLAIAIPSLIMYMFLSGRVEGLVMEMDELSQEVIKHVSAESLIAQGVAANLSATSRAKSSATSASASVSRSSNEPVRTT